MDAALENAMSMRQESNRVLVQLISDMIDGHPELRFHQILHSLDVVIPIDRSIPGHVGPGMDGAMQDLFYEESVKTLDRVSKAVEKMK